MLRETIKKKIALVWHDLFSMFCNNNLLTVPSSKSGLITEDNSAVNPEQDNTLFDTKIRRYLSLDHFIDMMECHRLYVNRRKAFDDVNERYIPFHWSGFLMPVGENIPPQPDRSQFWQDTKIEYSRWANMPTLCWTLTTQESYLMWKGYTGENGVCIVTTIRKFIASIQDSKDFQRAKCTVHCGQMIYNGFSTKDTDNLPFWKGREFASENELRFYFEIADDRVNDNHIFIPFNRSSLVDRLIISPFVRPKTALALAEMLHCKYEIIVSPSIIQVK